MANSANASLKMDTSEGSFSTHFDSQGHISSDAMDHFRLLCKFQKLKPAIDSYPCLPYPNLSYGPIFWDLLHRVAMLSRFNLIEEKVEEVLSLMDNVMNLFPCKLCRESYANYKVTREPTSSFIAREVYGVLLPNYSLFEWTWKIHNTSNEKLKKPQILYSEAYDIYSKKELL